MDGLAAKIVMAERHVQRGRRIIARQRSLIERRRRLGASTLLSEDVLINFETSQAIFEDDLFRLQRQQDGAPTAIATKEI